MAIEVQGKTIETDANGNLVNPQDWSWDVAKKLAAEEDIKLTQDHWRHPLVRQVSDLLPHR